MGCELLQDHDFAVVIVIVLLPTGLLLWYDTRRVGSCLAEEDGQEWNSYMGDYTCDGSDHVKRYMYVSDMAEEAMGRYCRPRIRGCIALRCVGWLIDELLI